MGSVKIPLARIYWVILFMLVFLFTSQAIAENKVVVIPLFGDEQQTLSTPAPVEKTGQTTSYATGDDGDLEKGVAWPNPRLTDNGNGTVTDNLTGLIWLQNAKCFLSRTWANALADCNALEHGQCGLTDGSSPGDWRMPNVRELHSLVDFGNVYPALPEEHPFTGVQAGYYWSSTTVENETSIVWAVNIQLGRVITYLETNYESVWPVRSDN